MYQEGRIDVHCDGGARGNPGPAAIGFTVKTDDGTMLARRAHRIGVATNNVAEYRAVIAALSWIREHQEDEKLTITSLRIFLDSRLVVNQLQGNFKVKDQHLKKLAIAVRAAEKIIGLSPVSKQPELLPQGLTVQYLLIPREVNAEADALVNAALNAH